MESITRDYYSSSICRSEMSVLLQEYYIKFCWDGRYLRYSVHVSVCPSARNNSAPNGRIFIKFDICGFFENLSRQVKFH